jgi:hypothetical protein
MAIFSWLYVLCCARLFSIADEGLDVRTGETTTLEVFLSFAWLALCLFLIMGTA